MDLMPRHAIDLHAHTAAGSACSVMTLPLYLRRLAQLEARIVTLTNHGCTADAAALAEFCEATRRVFVPGIEVTTRYGDVLVHAASVRAIERVAAGACAPWERDEPGYACTWAHPGMTWADAGEIEPPPVLHAVEVLSGNRAYFLLERSFNDLSARLAALLGLPGAGGSDCHHPGSVGLCWTELPEGVRSAADVVDALRAGEVAPGGVPGVLHAPGAYLHAGSARVIRDLYPQLVPPAEAGLLAGALDARATAAA